MSKESKQLEKELEMIRDKLNLLSSNMDQAHSEEELSSIATIVKYMAEERERTNRTLLEMTDKIRKMEGIIAGMYPQEEEVEASRQSQKGTTNREIPLSGLDVKIINFAQVKGMVCAEEVRDFMGYRGNNAACARLNKLHKEGLLERFQLGHKVYYKFDAGKTTNTLIISPPQ